MKLSLNAFLAASLAIYCNASLTEPTSESDQALHPGSRRTQTTLGKKPPKKEKDKEKEKDKKCKKKCKKANPPKKAIKKCGCPTSEPTRPPTRPPSTAPIVPPTRPPTSPPTPVNNLFTPATRLKACDQQQIIFKNDAINAADPDFKYIPDADGSYTIKQCKSDDHISGIEDSSGNQLKTTIYGYQQGDGPCTWPGKTFESHTDDITEVRWRNNIPPGPYIITSLDGLTCIDETLDWAYNIEGFKDLTVEKDSVPVVVHLHGTHSEDEYDGHATAFYTPNFEVTGPRFQQEDYFYENLPGTMWYHDHTHGITRLNVWAGMVGFWIVRDDQDTGEVNNPLQLPVFPYEFIGVIQDHTFKDNGEHFYSAYPGDPFYDLFINPGTINTFVNRVIPSLPQKTFGNVQAASIVLDQRGDYNLVNGKAWPKHEVEPRNYRLRFLNGADHAIYTLIFVCVDLGTTSLTYDFDSVTKLPFTVIQTDHGKNMNAKEMTDLHIENGSRYDLVFDFGQCPNGRVIAGNTGKNGVGQFNGYGDYTNPGGANCGDDKTVDTCNPRLNNNDRNFPQAPPEGSETFDFFQMCDVNLIMAFDVVLTEDTSVPDNFDPSIITNPINFPTPTNVRQLLLVQGYDEFSRIQVLPGTLGQTMVPVRDIFGANTFSMKLARYPDKDRYRNAGLVNVPCEGTLLFKDPITEYVPIGTTEIWEFWNLSDDHPVHIHLVDFAFVSRSNIKVDSDILITGDTSLCDPDKADEDLDGTCTRRKNSAQASGGIGTGLDVRNPTLVDPNVDATRDDRYEESTMDLINAPESSVTRVIATFDKVGLYLWHCHLLSHEDNEMMRQFVVYDPDDVSTIITNTE